MSLNATRILDLMESFREQGRPFCAVTIVRTAHATSAKAGAKALVTGDGALHGFVGGGCVQGAVKRAALAALESGQARLIRVKPKEDVVTEVDVDGVALYKSSCPSGGMVDLFLEPMRLAPALVICGASPVAAALVRLAQAMDCRVIVAAPGELHGEVPGASSYLDGFAIETIPLEPRDAVIVVTQGRRDREALAAALRSPSRYVGMVGSRRKIGRLREALAGEIPAERLAQLRGPAGLDIGAIEPEEIALSILGQLVQERRRQAHRQTETAVFASA